jgi:hypothetical protein
MASLSRQIPREFLCYALAVSSVARLETQRRSVKDDWIAHDGICFDIQHNGFGPIHGASNLQHH